MTIPQKIRHQRQLHDMTQTELGEKLGVKTNAISKWETGKVSDIPAGKIKKMAELFGVRPSYFIDEDVDESESPVLKELKSMLSGMTPEQLSQVKTYVRFIKSGG